MYVLEYSPPFSTVLDTTSSILVTRCTQTQWRFAPVNKTSCATDQINKVTHTNPHMIDSAYTSILL